jgi:glutathione S-transferase
MIGLFLLVQSKRKEVKMSEKIILYGSVLSQPTRAVQWFCKLNKIEYDFKEVNPRKGDLKSEDYTKM